MAKIILNVDLNSSAASGEIKKLKADLKGLGDPSGVKNIDSLRKSYSNLINTIQGAENNYKKGTFSKILEEAKDGLNKLKNPAHQSTEGLNKLDATLKKLQADFAETKTSATNFHGSLKDIVSGFMKFQLAAMIVMKPLQLIRAGFDSLNETLVETEKRVVALRRVAGEAANATELYDLAKKYGQSFQNVSDVVENFAKSGLSWAESLEAAEAALVALNVAELNSEQATEGMIAIMKQFGYEASDLINIIDKLNYTADNAAVTTEELLIALQKTGSTAVNAGLNLEETIALITALSEGTAASGQNIGNALRSLFIFTSDKDALKTFASLSSDMENIVKGYQSGQNNILDVWKGLGKELGNLENSKGLLSELFGATDLTQSLEAELTQIEDQFAEIYGTAGNYRQNYFTALLKNIEDVQTTVDEMGNSVGYSAKENAQAMETYEKKVESLKAQWQELLNEEQGFLEFKKDLVDVGSGILTLIEYTGGLNTILISTGIAAVGVFGPSAVKMVGKMVTALWSASTAISAIQASLVGVGLLFGVGSAIYGLINKTQSDRAENSRLANERITERLNETKDNLHQLGTALEEISESYQKTIKSIQEYRGVLDNSSSTESEKAKASNELLTIQNKLVESNNAYADSLDLTNGKLEDQIALLKQKSVEQIKEEIKNYQLLNATGIEQAKTILGSTYDSIEFSDYESTELGVAVYNFLKDNPQYKDVGAFTLRRARGNNTELKLNGMSGKEIMTLMSDMIDYVDANMADSEDKAYVLHHLMAMRGEFSNYDTSETLINGNPNAKNWIERLSNEDRNNIYRGVYDENKILDLFESVMDVQKEITKDSAEWRNSLDQIGSGTLDKLVEKLKEARDASKESYDYENKKKAVLEAEKALMDAQNNRMSRVYNSRTGQWEWASNERTVQDAEEALEKARLAVEQSAYDDIIELLKSDNITNAALLEVMARWAGAYGSGDFSAFSAEIKELVKQTTGVDLDAPDVATVLQNTSGTVGTIASNVGASVMGGLLRGVTTPLFDNGGVLRGLGGIKATSSDEVVLGPTLTKSILSPVSNKQFDTFIKDLGILFGVSESARKDGVSFRDRGGFSDSHDTSYVINGVPISQQMAETNTVGELLRLIPLIN